MSSTIAGFVLNDVGVPILAGDPASRKAFFRLFFDTEIRKKFVPYVTPQAQGRLEQVLAKRFGDDPEITIAQLSNVVEQLLAIRDPSVVPPELEPAETVVDDRARDSQGQFLSEFDVWANDPHRSMKEIRTRADREPDFGAWFRAMAVSQTFQDGGLRIAGAPTRTATEADFQVLGEFVKLYQSVPSDQLKPRGGRITLDAGHSYTAQQFEELVSRASEVGLL
jgi:hypothetical protein